jgi:DNA-binding IclR family transcriptional regulator
MTENTITDREDLLEELEQVRNDEFATNSSETIGGLVGIGAPVLDQDSTVVGGISIIGPESRLDDDGDYEQIAQEIQQAINVIEINSTSIASR